MPTTEALALTEHINGGIRRYAGELFSLSAPDASLSAMHAAGLIFPMNALREVWWSSPGRVLSPLGEPEAAAPAPDEDMPGVLRILSMCDYDPGNAAYRYHSAINSLGPHASAFVRWNNANPHCDLRQWDGFRHRSTIEALYYTAHVLHVHIDFRILRHNLMMPPRGILVRHYHGSIEPGWRDVLVEQEIDDQLGAIQVGARLYHLQFSPRMRWLPIPVPIESYALLAMSERRARGDDGVVRIAHSPTMRHRKGTEVLLDVVSALQKEGAPLALDLIENLQHGEALRRRAACDITFDSFWLGMQGSGLEGAAMGQVVIAGDPEAKLANEKFAGSCPYTYANDAGALRRALEAYLEDPAWRAAEAGRVHAFVRAHHDYPVVARRYAEIIAEHVPDRGVVIPDLPAPGTITAEVLFAALEPLAFGAWRPLYMPADMAAGVPSTLFGFPVVEVEGMPVGEVVFGPPLEPPVAEPPPEAGAPLAAGPDAGDPAPDGVVTPPSDSEPVAGRSALDAVLEEPFGALAPEVSSGAPAPGGVEGVPEPDPGAQSSGGNGTPAAPPAPVRKKLKRRKRRRGRQ